MRPLYNDGLSEIRPAKLSDMLYLAEHLRRVDKDEIWASNHHLPFQSLKLGLEVSKECLTATLNGMPYCAFGYCEHNEEMGGSLVWLLGTDIIKKIPKIFMKHTKQILYRFHEVDPVLFNVVDCRNKTSIRWLKQSGAKFSKPFNYGKENLPFLKFILEKGANNV